MKNILLVILLSIVGAFSTNAIAGGGDDHTHGDGAVAVTASTAKDGQLRIVSYPGGLEVFVKYPAPKLNEPVIGRLFFADYATNHPVDPTGIELSFPGAFGAKVTKQPTKISDGVYEFVALFARDTGHTALLRYTYGAAEQLASLSPFYAGASATRAMSATGGNSLAQDEDGIFPTWILIPIAIGLALLFYVLFTRRRKRLQFVKSQSSASTISKANASTVTQTISK